MSEKFKKVTGYDIAGFFDKFTSFVSDSYYAIVNYYSGGPIVNQSFTDLDYLLGECPTIESLFELNESSLDTLDMVELLDSFSDVYVKLLTIKNTGRWQRSSRLGVQSQQVKVNRIQKQGETLEGIVKQMGADDPENSWLQVAVNNKTIEEDYTPQGGKLFVLTLQNKVDFDVPNVVDFSVPANLYGKDIQRKISFVGGDVVTLSGQPNLYQNLSIKLSTVKGSIPEFPNDGFSDSLFGTSQSVIQYPTLLRDLSEMFKKDARWREFSLIDIKRVEDSVFARVECKAILDDVFNKDIPL